MKPFVNTFIKKVPTLNHFERKEVQNALSAMDDHKQVCELIEEQFDSQPRCPYCQTEKIYKHGMRSGLQRYRCTHCSKTFNALTATPLARLKKKELWLQNINCMLTSDVLRFIGTKLHIDKKTAFLWRHRFSLWLYHDRPAKLEGIVEADETY